MRMVLWGHWWSLARNMARLRCRNSRAQDALCLAEGTIVCLMTSKWSMIVRHASLFLRIIWF